MNARAATQAAYLTCMSAALYLPALGECIVCQKAQSHLLGLREHSQGNKIRSDLQRRLSSTRSMLVLLEPPPETAGRRESTC